MNTTLQALNASMTANQTVQATSMIGHGVLVAGKGVDLVAGTPGLGGFELTQPVDSAQVSIYDKAGALVRTIDLGAQAAGVSKWQWDGTDNAGAAAAAGGYTFAVNALQGGNAVTATSLQFGMVNSVTQSAQGVALSVGSLDGVALSQVKQIL
jgi:flagellar basal-body rod modification protein FlgD